MQMTKCAWQSITEFITQVQSEALGTCKPVPIIVYGMDNKWSLVCLAGNNYMYGRPYINTNYARRGLVSLQNILCQL